MIEIKLPLKRMSKRELVDTFVRCCFMGYKEQDDTYRAIADEILEQEGDRICGVKP